MSHPGECTHPAAETYWIGTIESARLLWCGHCGSIARSDGLGALHLPRPHEAQPPITHPGRTAWWYPTIERERWR